MTYNEIENRIRRFLVEEMEIDSSRIVPEGNLKKDIGVDSLELVDLAVFVETEFGVKVKSEEMTLIKTLKQLCAFVQDRIK